jgi:hypothetical protein
MDDQANRDDDDTPHNPRIHSDAVNGLGALHLSVDDVLSTAAACYSVAQMGRDHARKDDQVMSPAQIAQLFQLAATWIRVLGEPSMAADIADIERQAADVIRTAAAGDLDRIRRTAH